MICIVHTCNNMQDKIKSAIFNKYEIPVINKTFHDLLFTTATHKRVRSHETTYGTGSSILNPMTAGILFQFLCRHVVQKNFTIDFIYRHVYG